MAEIGHYYPWASPSYLLDEMSLDQWWIFYSLIPDMYRIENNNPVEPQIMLDVPPVNGVRIKRK